MILNKGLDNAARLTRLNLTGLVFLSVIILSHVGGGFQDYRQRLLNVRVMLSLRRSLYERLLHLPLPRLWEMKTGGILSRLTGDVETTTGLLQMAIVSPAISGIRLVIAIVILIALNWQLALTAMAIIPGVMVLSLIFVRRIRPIYRSVRRDVEIVDGRVAPSWHVELTEDGSVLIGPKAWRRRTFWWDYFNDEPEPPADYTRGLAILRKHSTGAIRS